jgi:2-polyprenyl-3-methyl-5-hydroxy-6-metoxy-1,4-benzoquinol methylase
MPHDVDIVVTSNIPKKIAEDVEVIPGLPTRDPRSLPFAHKKVFADRLESYDLFVYTEDDVLIRLRNLNAFLLATEVLGENELAGFLRSETDQEGNIYFPDVHFHFHWDAASLSQRETYFFARFTNLHSGCYTMTRQQLKRAIASGGFLVQPHQGAYQTLESAATDPYTQCGFRKMICVSHIEEFIVPHLSNRYAGQVSLPASDFYTQLTALSSVSKNGKNKSTLFPVETNVLHRRWSKSYYEPCQTEAIALVPETVKTVLSVGCGWGVTEKCLVERGLKVKALPIDPVIAASAEARGIEMIYDEGQGARANLARQRFDCLLILNVLHLVPDPVKFLASFALLCPDGCVIVSVPNVSRLRRFLRRIRFRNQDANPKKYEVHGMHLTTGQVIRGWLRQAGLKPLKMAYEVSDMHKSANRRLLGLAKPMLAETCYVLAVLHSSHAS